jgi:hypothetical protein
MRETGKSDKQCNDDMYHESRDPNAAVHEHNMYNEISDLLLALFADKFSNLFQRRAGIDHLVCFSCSCSQHLRIVCNARY